MAYSFTCWYVYIMILLRADFKLILKFKVSHFSCKLDWKEVEVEKKVKYIIEEDKESG